MRFSLHTAASFRSLFARYAEPENIGTLMRALWGTSIITAAIIIIVVVSISASITLAVFNDLGAISSQSSTPARISFNADTLQALAQELLMRQSPSTTTPIVFSDPSR